MNKLTMIYPYYNAPQMLATHLFSWSMFPKDVLQHLLFIIVDDCSQHSPALQVVKHFQDSRLPIRLYQVDVDIPWNQHGARNLAAMKAPKGWMLMSDIDHTVPLESVEWILRAKLDQGCFYTFQRMTRVPGGKVEPMLKDGKPKPHPNTYLLTRGLFWRAGGYDEDFCGTYGGDGPFRRLLNQAGQHVHLGRVSIVRWPREVIPDASQQPEFREAYRGLYYPKFKEKGGSRMGKPIDWIRFPWSRLI